MCDVPIAGSNVIIKLAERHDHARAPAGVVINARAVTINTAHLQRAPRPNFTVTWRWSTVAFPYPPGRPRPHRHRDPDEHIRQMLEQLLFTGPGERVNRPDFGCGLLDLVFGPNSPEMAAAVEVTIAAAVGRWLGDLIAVHGARRSTSEDSRLVVDLSYQVLATGAGAERAWRPGGSA